MQQRTDIFLGTQESFSFTNFGVSTGSSAVAGGLVAPIPRFIVPGNPFGVNRFAPTFQTLTTKAENGIIQNISTTSAIKGAVGSQVGELPKKAGEAAIDAAKKKACQRQKDGCK